MISLAAKRVCLARLRPAVIAQRNKATPAYDGHVPLNWAENAFMAFGSALAALADPRRGDMVAALGETTAGPFLPRLRDEMIASPEGRAILKHRPRVNTDTVDMLALSRMPEGSWGHTYVTWLDRCGVTPDTREPVHYIDDPELAYVMTRYRECHDFYHAICGLSVSVPSELALKVFELANFRLPSTALSALSGRLTPHQRDRFVREFVPWALRCGASTRPLITVFWEKRWDQPVEDLKRELGIWDPPNVEWGKSLSEAKRMRERREAEARKTAGLA
ncbi:putative COQ4 protein, responsible for restoring ubiquinone biosynthesis [Ceratobasidium sp. AG-I]|nr:putative COQ4 protein, responsible for restoring ubiquinone biosynthesis [Ceratobasidium sp. AG-I]